MLWQWRRFTERLTNNEGREEMQKIKITLEEIILGMATGLGALILIIAIIKLFSGFEFGFWGF
jgi:hypothetical protein